MIFSFLCVDFRARVFRCRFCVSNCYFWLPWAKINECYFSINAKVSNLCPFGFCAFVSKKKKRSLAETTASDHTGYGRDIDEDVDSQLIDSDNETEPEIKVEEAIEKYFGGLTEMRGQNM